MTLHITEPIAWMIPAVFGFFTMIINSLILQKEWKARKSQENTFATKYLKIYSILSMICGVLNGLFTFLQYFNGFCYFIPAIMMQVVQLQPLFMGLYQLERLHFCFAQSQVHSNKGYSNWIFFIMGTIGILLAVYYLIYPWFVLYTSLCGINIRYQYVSKYSKWYELYTIMMSIAAMSYMFWDGMTLFLYVFKVISFKQYKSTNIEIYNRIMSILNRILILTITYEMVVIGNIIVYVIVIIGNDDGTVADIIYVVNGCFTSITMTFSMYLMQQHNTDQYKNFLQIVYTLKFHYICCCCCKSMINYEMEMYSDEKKLEIDVKKNEKQKKDNGKKKNDDTIWETRNASPKIEEINVDPFELSIETTAQK